jgi:hypothetical protein
MALDQRHARPHVIRRQIRRKVIGKSADYIPADLQAAVSTSPRTRRPSIRRCTLGFDVFRGRENFLKPVEYLVPAVGDSRWTQKRRKGAILAGCCPLVAHSPNSSLQQAP